MGQAESTESGEEASELLAGQRETVTGGGLPIQHSASVLHTPAEPLRRRRSSQPAGACRSSSTSTVGYSTDSDLVLYTHPPYKKPALHRTSPFYPAYATFPLSVSERDTSPLLNSDSIVDLTSPSEELHEKAAGNSRVPDQVLACATGNGRVPVRKEGKDPVPELKPQTGHHILNSETSVEHPLSVEHQTRKHPSDQPPNLQHPTASHKSESAGQSLNTALHTDRPKRHVANGDSDSPSHSIDVIQHRQSTSQSLEPSGHLEEDTSQPFKEKLREVPLLKAVKQVELPLKTSDGIIDLSDNDEDLEFNPEDLHRNTSTPRLNRHGIGSGLECVDNAKEVEMDLSITRHEPGGVPPASAGPMATGGGVWQEPRPSRPIESRPLYPGERVPYAAPSTSAPLPSSSKSSRKNRSSSKSSKRSKSQSRARSDSSLSDISGTSMSSKGTENKKKKIKDKVFKSQPKGSITNKWQAVNNEFQDDKSKRKKSKKTKEEKHVSKMTRSDKHENVGHAFGKGMALPMQHGPPGARVQDIEGESMSDASAHSWTAMTPMSARPSRPSRSDVKHFSSSSEHRRYTAAAAANGSQHAGRDSTGHATAGASGGHHQHQQHRHSSQHSTGQVTKSAPDSQTHHTKYSRQSSSKHSGRKVSSGGESKHGKSGKLYKKKAYEIEDTAAQIVDDAIQGALGLWYGNKYSSGASSKKRSRSSSHTRRSQSSSAAQTAQSSKHSSSAHTSKHDTNIIRDYRSENVYRENIVKDLRGRKSLAPPNVEQRGRRTSRFRPIRGSLRSPEDRTFHQQGMSRGSSARGSATQSMGMLPPPGSFYELGITPYSREPPPGEQQEDQASLSQSKAYSTGDVAPSRFHVGGPRTQSMDIPALPAPPQRQTQTNTEEHSSSQQYYEEQSQHYTSSQTMQSYGEDSTSKSKSQYSGVNPPTITRGTVTRVLHELPASQQSKMYASQSGLEQWSPSSPSWPPRPASAPHMETQHVMTTSSMSGLDHTSRNIVLPAGIEPQHVPGMHSATSPGFDAYAQASSPRLSPGFDSTRPHSAHTFPALDDSRMLGYPAPSYYPDPLSRPASVPAVLEGQYGGLPPPGPGIAIRHYPHYINAGAPPSWPASPQQAQSLGNLYQSTAGTPQHNLSGSATILHKADSTKYNVSPGMPWSANLHGEMSPRTAAKMDYSAYSNEPMIIADLLDKEQSFQHTSPSVQYTPNTGAFYSNRGQSPSVTMGKQQTLNFFVFGNQSQSESDLHRATYDMESRYAQDDLDLHGFYMDQQADYVDYETRSEPDYSERAMREVLIHHKQTQTLPPPKKKPTPPVIKRIEKKEMQSFRHTPPPQKQVKHKETTHYITKETQIEKVPPEKHSTATQYEKPYKPKDTRVEVTKQVFAPRVTETRDIVREMMGVQEEPPQPEFKGREVPIDLTTCAEDNIVEIIDRFNEPPAVPDEESSESEMEIIETVEIEEREQRLSMAIFEEVEFTMERTKGGHTEVITGKGSDLLPFEFPGRYEATVDRRKQKCLQVKETHKGGSHRYEYDTNVHNSLPAPGAHEAIEMPELDSHHYDDPEVVDHHFDDPEVVDHHFDDREVGDHHFDNELHSAHTERHFDIEPTDNVDHLTEQTEKLNLTASHTRNLSNDTPGHYITHHVLPVRHTSMRGKAMPKGGGEVVREEKWVVRESKGKPSRAIQGYSVLPTPYSPRKPVPVTLGSSSGYSSSDTAVSSGFQQQVTSSLQQQQGVNQQLQQEEGGEGYSPSTSAGRRPLYAADSDTEESRIYTSELKDINLTPQGQSPRESVDLTAEQSDEIFFSRYDPENIYFRVPQWRDIDSKKKYSKSRHHVDIEKVDTVVQEGYEVPDSLPMPVSKRKEKSVEKSKMGQKYFGTPQMEVKSGGIDVTDTSQSSPDAPKLRTRVVRDADGNLVKITEVEKTVTKTEEYMEDEPKADGGRLAEEMRGGEYLEMNVSQITEGQRYEQEVTEEEVCQITGALESGEEPQGGGEEEEELHLYPVGPEVMSETTVALQPVEYDIQTRSLPLRDDPACNGLLPREYDVQTRSLPLQDDPGNNLHDQQYLYDMRTATLEPLIIRDAKSGEMLMQYGYNDMITPL